MLSRTVPDNGNGKYTRRINSNKKNCENMTACTTDNDNSGDGVGKSATTGVVEVHKKVVGNLDGDIAKCGGGGGRDDDDDSCNSADEALLEMLGLPSTLSMNNVKIDVEEEVLRRPNCSNSSPLLSPYHDTPVPCLSDDEIRDIISKSLLLSDPPPDSEESSSSSSSSSSPNHNRNKSRPPSVFRFPTECSVQAKYMRRITDELIYSSDSSNIPLTTTTTTTSSKNKNYHSDKTYETIQVMKRKKSTTTKHQTDDDGNDPAVQQLCEGRKLNEFGECYEEDEENLHTTMEIEHRRVLTRMERFVDTHPGWSELCHGYLPKLLSALVGEEMVLYKEKLNLKPPGTSGFAPHLDTPSLRVAASSMGSTADPSSSSSSSSTSESSTSNVNDVDNTSSVSSTGPRNFWTVMVAIDDMTTKNGCLRVVHGQWDENNCVPYIQPQEQPQLRKDDRGGLNILNPDGDGRAGAIPTDYLDEQQRQGSEALPFDDIVCKGGTVVAFNGWVPHRSSPNKSPFPRRAVFLTYNPKSEGDYHHLYYQRMDELRQAWRNQIGLRSSKQRTEDEKIEQQWLSTLS